MTNNLRRLPPGYVFDPTDLQLIECYLRKKINGVKLSCDLVHEIEVYATSPDLIAEKLKPREGKAMYMFSSRDKKHANGTRPNRVIANGDGSYWRQSGHADIYDTNNLHVGTRTNLVFMIKKKKEKKKGNKGIKSKWLMSEYTINDTTKWNNLVLCKIYETPRQKKDAEQDDEDSQPDVIDDNDASEDVSDSLLNGVKRSLSEPSLVEPLEVPCSKIRRVSSDQPLPSSPSQFIASSSMGPSVQISAVSVDEVNSLGQEIQMNGSQQEEQSTYQVPSNGEVDWNNLPILDYDINVDEVDWKTLYEIASSPSNHDQSVNNLLNRGFQQHTGFGHSGSGNTNVWSTSAATALVSNSGLRTD